jgi:hypothetical protein
VSKVACENGGRGHSVTASLHFVPWCTNINISNVCIVAIRCWVSRGLHLSRRRCINATICYDTGKHSSHHAQQVEGHSSLRNKFRHDDCITKQARSSTATPDGGGHASPRDYISHIGTVCTITSYPCEHAVRFPVLPMRTCCAFSRLTHANMLCGEYMTTCLVAAIVTRVEITISMLWGSGRKSRQDKCYVCMYMTYSHLLEWSRRSRLLEGF